ncbi:hypothetical protein [Galbibacter sp. PAP.153]|uniref:hypothetical protein n=1 Tax=Galbibacter sp. PAP.153 TaxID=3104623 RepID=UPI003008703C
MSFLRDAIQSLDPTPDKKKELTLAVNLLFELAEQKNALQKETLKQLLRTAGTPENPTIPITNTLAFHGETRAYVSENAGTLVDTVTGAIKKFIGGEADGIVDGIGELVTGGLEAILGAGEGSQSEMHSYYIIVDGLSITRLDIMAWQRKIEATGITSAIENAMTFTAVKSSVDVDKITFNTFLQAYKEQLEKMDFSDKELIEFIKRSKEIFELLKDENSKSKKLVSAGATELMNPGTISRLDSTELVSKGFSNVPLIKKGYTYSFRLTYDVYQGKDYKGTVRTDWEVFYKGHHHGVRPSDRDIHNQLVVLTGEVEAWCDSRDIPFPGVEDIHENYDLDTKSAH